jgi:WD40 repeat protein
VARRWALPALVEPPFRGGIAFFSPDGKWLVQRSGSTYRLVSTVTRASESVNFNTAGFYPVAFAPGGDRVAVRVRQPAPGGPPQFPGLELRTFENGRIGAQSLTPTMRAIGNLAAAAFSPDGSALVTVHLNRGAELGWVMNAWDTRTGRQIGRRAMARVRDIVFSFDGKTVFCDDGANLQAWKLAEDRLEKVNLPAGARPSRWTMAEHRGLAACVMSRRSGGAAGGKADTEVRSIEVWEYPGWKRVVQLEIDEPISELSFSNDAALLFSSTPDGTFRIWDWQQRSQVGSIATQDPVLGMGYRADQRLVALQAGRLRSYLWREEDLKDALCKAAGRQLTLAEWKGAQLEEAEFPKKPLCPPPANVEE